MKSLLSIFLIAFAFPIYAAQSASSIVVAHRGIIADIQGFIQLQSRVSPELMRSALADITPHLNPQDQNMAMRLFEIALKAKPKSMTRFLILNSLGGISNLESPAVFDRLIDFFEDEKNESADTTSVSNSLRAAAIQSGNLMLLERLALRSQLCKNQSAVADYIFYFGQEREALIPTQWYLPWVMNKLTDYGGTSFQVRANAARELRDAVRHHPKLIPDSVQLLIFQKLRSSVDQESNQSVLSTLRIAIAETNLECENLIRWITPTR